MTDIQIKNAVEKFEALIREQSDRSDKIKAQGDFVDYEKLDKIVIGVCGGDGIGPIITKESARVLEYMLADKVKTGKVEFKVIDGLTIENRVAANKAIPDDVLEELKSCHVILKGPTTTPQQGGPWPNIESANVAMRKALDLFANLRPVKVPEEGIDWTFFRENTEGAYAVGSKGVNVTDDLAVDFVVTTTEGCERIAKLAYDYARRNHKDRVSIITKANIIKTTDGKFLNLCKNIGKDYPEITTDEWYIGKKYAMFEAIHGSAPRMIEEGRGQYADPCSMLRASVMLLSHIGEQEKADMLEKALDICMFTEKKLTITGRDTGCTCSEFGDYVMETVKKLSK